MAAQIRDTTLDDHLKKVRLRIKRLRLGDEAVLERSLELDRPVLQTQL